MAVTLILGSGGARGLSFIGAIRCLNDAGISIDRVVGTSMGAIIGAAFCGGTSLDVVAHVLQGLKISRFARPSLFGPGLFSNRPVAKLVKSLLSVQTFEALRIPLAVVCTDIKTGAAIVFERGELIGPVVGSSLAAGLFDPMISGGFCLVDGGYAEPVPVRLGSPSSVNVAINVTVNPSWNPELKPGISLAKLLPFSRTWRQVIKSYDILISNLAREQLSRTTYVNVVPSLEGMGFLDFGNGTRAIAAGYEAMIKAVPNVQKEIVRLNSTNVLPTAVAR